MERFQIGVITHDETVARRLEPGAPPPALRFEQMAQLVRADVKTRVRVAPIVPGFTDSDGTLDAVFDEAAAAGATHATINALHLRPATVASLKSHLTPCEFGRVRSQYEAAGALRVCGGKSRQIPLPRDARLELFRRARATASTHGIETHICGCMNPDLTDERCALAGEWASRDADDAQMALLPEGA